MLKKEFLAHSDESSLDPLWLARECIARAWRVLGTSASHAAVEFLACQFVDDWKKEAH